MQIQIAIIFTSLKNSSGNGLLYPCDRLPTGDSIHDPTLPSLQHPIAILAHCKILVVIRLQLCPGILQDFLVQWQLPETGSCVPDLPLLVFIGPFYPLRALTGYDVHDIPSKDLLLKQHPVLIFTWHSSIPHIKSCIEVEKCLPESRKEEWKTVCPIENSMDKHIRMDPPHQVENCFPWAVCCPYLISVLERNIESLAVSCQPAPCLLNPLCWPKTWLG